MSNECICLIDNKGVLHPRRDCPVHGQASKGKHERPEDKK